MGRHRTYAIGAAFALAVELTHEVARLVVNRPWEGITPMASHTVSAALAILLTATVFVLPLRRESNRLDVVRWDLGVLASSTAGGGSRDQGAALELGYRVIDNLWLSGGCIAGRYADAELFSADASWTGVYVRIRFKFDETTFQRSNPQVNRSLGAAATSARQ